MKNISLTFLVHQPVTLKRYRFLDIGHDDNYYDDYDNERRIRNLADECYLPNNRSLFKLLTRNSGHFKVAFCISGTAIDLFTLYAPEVIKSFQELASTGRVEFLAQTYSHSLASLKNIYEFGRQAEIHARKTAKLFGKRPQVFKNTELLYSDTIGKSLAREGYRFILAETGNFPEGKGPDHIYSSPTGQGLKIMFKNTWLSNKVASLLSNHEPKGHKQQKESFASFLNKMPENGNTICLCIKYDLIRSSRLNSEKDVNHFESFITDIAKSEKLSLKTPSELCEENDPESEISIPDSFNRTEKSGSFEKLLGNELQNEALDKLYGLTYRINPEKDHVLWKDWQYIQSSDHFFYMSSRFFSDCNPDHQYNPYDNPYEAFINYMNVLSDFTRRLHTIPSRELVIVQNAIKSGSKFAAGF